MSYCRQLLFEVRTLKLVPCSLQISDTFRRSHVSVHRFPYSFNVRPNEDSGAASAATISPPRPVPMSDRCISPKRSSKQKLSESMGKATQKGQMEIPPVADLSSYETACRHGTAPLLELHADVWFALVKDACSKKLPITISHLITDILDSFHGRELDRYRLIQSLLSNVDMAILEPSQVLSLLARLAASPDATRTIPRQIVKNLLRWFMNKANTSPEADSLLAILCPITLYHLKTIVVPSGARLITYTPPAFISVCYVFVCDLLKIGQDQQALNIFRMLVRLKHIPREAIRLADNNTNDPIYPVTSTLIRASLLWGWRGTAVDFLLDLLRSKRCLNEQIADLTVDTLYNLLDTPTPSDMKSFVLLVQELVNREPHHVLPDGLFRQFYDLAHQRSLEEEAEQLYSFTRSDTVLAVHSYPPPQGVALYWLMQYITMQSRNQHLGRELVTQIVDGCEPVPLQVRSKFIALTACSGFAQMARTLWERYSVGKDQAAIFGHPMLMLRMISLFTHLAKRARAKLHGLEDALEGDENLSKLSDSNEDLTDDTPDATSHPQQLQDLTAFADRVLSEYIRVNEPLDQAHHYVLTSLARAYFITGKFDKGFGTLRQLIGRKEIPDIYDINVALSAIAEQEPRAAAKMIEQMVAKGLEPDAVTFGTVLHHALLHEDMVLASNMINQARKLNGGRITLKSIATLIRASLDNDEEPISAQRTNLSRTLKTLRTLHHCTFICSPDIGNYCISAALRVDEPVLAFQFWDLLVKGKTQWDDAEQVFQRRSIAKMIRVHRKRQWLNGPQTRRMLSQLREKT